MESYLPVPADARIREYVAASKSPSTKRTVMRYWALWEGWCALHDWQPMPADLARLKAWLVYLVDQHVVKERTGRSRRVGVTVKTLELALWAVNTVHVLHGLPAPGQDEGVKALMGGIRRKRGRTPEQKAPLTIVELDQVEWGRTPRAIRDKALLCVGFAACLRVSELVALRVEDLEPTKYGLRVLIRKSKTDQEGRGAWVDIVHSERYPNACAVAALMVWLKLRGNDPGLLFQSTLHHKWIGQALTRRTVDQAIKRAVISLGLDPARYSCHSLRSGCATHLTDERLPATRIMAHGRWKSPAMLARYDRGAVASEIERVW